MDTHPCISLNGQLQYWGILAATVTLTTVGTEAWGQTTPQTDLGAEQQRLLRYGGGAAAIELEPFFPGVSSVDSSVGTPVVPESSSVQVLPTPVRLPNGASIPQAAQVQFSPNPVLAPVTMDGGDGSLDTTVNGGSNSELSQR